VKGIVKVVATVELPRLPNFVRTIDGQQLPIEALDDESLRCLGQAWACSSSEHARTRREARAGVVS